MNLARWRFPFSIRHDVVIPALVVIGLWATAAWSYGMNMYAGGAAATPGQAIAIMKQRCGRFVPPEALNHPFTARLKDGAWLVSADLREHLWSRTDRTFSGIVDAETGRILTCDTGVID